jgi:Putative DNA-binding domain
MTTSSKSQPKGIKEEFAKFYENPSRDKLRDLIRDNLGEFFHLDFKEVWPSLSKIARHILGLANSDRGCIVVGVAEKEDKTIEAKGVENSKDKAEIVNGIQKFLPSVLLDRVEILDFAYEASEYPKIVGEKFQVILVGTDPKHLPFISMAEGDGINRNKIYVRRGTSTEEANYQELQNVINKRLETGYSSRNEIDLRTHMEELEMLYGLLKSSYVIPTGFISSQLGLLGSTLKDLASQYKSVPNPHYPAERYEEFIARMIEKKKKRIEILLDVSEK